METWTREQIMKGLIEMFDDGAMDYIHKSEDKGWKEGRILCSGEGGISLKGLPVFDYWQELDYLVIDEGLKMPSSYDLGTLVSVKKWLAERGWMTEWQDAGTMLLWAFDNNGK